MASTRHLDRRRNLQPRDYLRDPFAFGREPGAELAVPAGGDGISLQIAARQHVLVVAWRARGKRPRSSEICRRWGFSSSTFSRIVLGERWAGETGLAAFDEVVFPVLRVPAAPSR